MSENTTKTFTVTDELGTFTFKRTEKGYCTKNGKRVSAKVFEQAERLYEEKLTAEIDANVEAAKGIAAGHVVLTVDPDAPMVEAELHCGFAEDAADDRDLTPDEMEELFDLRANKLMSWYELAQRYGISERRAREVFGFVRKLDAEVEAVEVTPEVPEPVTGNTEVTYEDEPVPAKPEFVIPGVRKDQASVGHKDGHEYVHDWFGKRYFRDGEEITKFEYEHEVHGVEAPKPAKPGAKRARRPKDVAGTYETSEGTVTLTLKQKCFLIDLSHLGEDELLGNVHGGVWCDILCDQIGGQFAGKPMSVGAMLSTICEKGLGERFKERREDGTGTGRGKLVTVFRLTEKGEEVWKAMGL